MRTNDLFKFIAARHKVYTLRAAGVVKPWTVDPILQRYRFCNVYRELDAVTIWIRDYWRSPHGSDPHLWFGMAVARLLNQPASLGCLKWPVPWRPEAFRSTLHQRAKRGFKNFNAAYIVSTNGIKMDKVDYITDRVLTPLWKQREDLRPKVGDRLEQFHTRLVTCQGVGSFIAAQIIADTKFRGVLEYATDWWTWAAPGPGSLRGMNRVTNRELKTAWEADYWLDQLNELGHKINVLAHTAEMPRISAQDLQNCLCEWDKYERVRLGQGRPKQLYPGLN